MSKKDVEIISDIEGIKNFEEAVSKQVKMSDIEVIDSEVVKVETEPQMSDEEALQMMPTNIPYEKIFNDEGELANPILKGNPYLNPFMNRRDKRALIRKATKNPKNNKKGIRLIVTPFAKGKFVKTVITKQRIPETLVGVLSPNGNVVDYKTSPSRVLTHNNMQLRNE